MKALIVTVDGTHIHDPQERIRLFGQPDHVRMYGRDYLQRLEQVGFSVQVVPWADVATDNERVLYRVSSEDIYFCMKDR